jgi:hypothetical protein
MLHYAAERTTFIGCPVPPGPGSHHYQISEGKEGTMTDPNLALSTIRDLGRKIREDHTASRAKYGLALAEHLLVLDEEIIQGGVLPDDWQAKPADGRIPPLAFRVEEATSAEQAYQFADEIASRYFGDRRYVLHAKSAEVTSANVRADGAVGVIRYDVEFTATPIGDPDA